MVFAALKDDCLQWVEKLRHSTFQVRGETKITSVVLIVFTLIILIPGKAGHNYTNFVACI